MLAQLLRWVRSRGRWALLLLLGVLGTFAGRLLWAEYHLRAARRALERRAYPEARSHLDRYLRVWPRSGPAHLLAARAARGAADFDEAERLLLACANLGADREALALEEYLLDAQRGTLDPRAEQVLWYRVKQEHPETPHILEALTLGYLYTNRPGEAMACLERWLAHSPGDGQALYLRGLAWEGMGGTDKAGEDYRRAVRRDPEHPQARRRLAEYLLSVGKHEEAAEHLEHLLGRGRADAVLLLDLARCRRLQGRAEEARSLLDEALACDPCPVSALVERARLEQERSDFRAAEKWYRRAVDRDPSDYEACHGLAQCLRALKRPEEAAHFQARAARIDRDLKRLARLHEEMARKPEDAELAYEAGMICLRNGQKDEARRWFRKALRLNPDHQGARRGLEQLRGE
jgi:tetratricopeptide (TPR) repeat protein